MRSTRAVATRLGIALFATFTAMMLGLAAGAVWMIPTLYLQRSLPWLALPAGWLLGLAVRHWIQPVRGLTAAWGALATLLAATYLQILLAAARIASSLGIGLPQAMREGGLSMLLALARVGVDPADVAWALAGAALAAWIARRPAATRPAP